MTGHLTDQHKKKLRTWIGRQSIGFNLIYRATSDGLSAASFHQQCDKHGATVTVCYGVNKYVYGGYTSVSWSPESEGVKHDKTAFLFRLMANTFTPDKFQTKDGQNAISAREGHGPSFGTVVFFSGAPILKTAENVYPLNWVQRFGQLYNANGVSFADFTGNNNNVTEVEVYKVEDDYQLLDGVMPWRKTDSWTPKLWEKLKKEVEEYCPLENLDIEYVQILMIGPIGAGKSTFFNTINSIYRDRITNMAQTGSLDHSVTKKFRKYQVLKGRAGKPLHFRLCDTMGLEEGQGLDEKDLPYILDGHIPNRYQFNPTTHVTPETSGFIKNPTMGDRIHCVAFVLDSSQMAVLSEVKPDDNALIQKLANFREMITDRDIPQVVLLTKIDEICPMVKEDVSRVFNSSTVHDAVKKAAALLGMPPANVLPVKNYERETEMDTAVDILALFSLRQMVRYSDDFLENLSDRLQTETG